MSEVNKWKHPIPCGRTLGHGENCCEGHLCGACTEIKKLRAEGKKPKKKKGPMPAFPQDFVDAFLIIMLHKIEHFERKLGMSGASASQTLTVEQLEAFSNASHGNKTVFSYDEDTNSVTISSPNQEKESPILVPHLIKRN